jgi:hypothetical protein
LFGGDLGQAFRFCRRLCLFAGGSTRRLALSL